MAKSKHKPVLSIIVPVMNQATKTVQCFQSIRMFTATPYELIWVDNGSGPDHYSIIRRQATRPRVHCKLVKNEHNLGYVRAVNQGLQEARGEYVVLLNNDTEVTAGWDKKLLRPFRAEGGDRVGAVGPITDSQIAWQGVTAVERRWSFGLPRFNGDHNGYSKKLHKAFGGKYIEVGGRKLPLSFFCCCIPRKLFEEIGGLDEDFGIGLGDDDDMALRMSVYGYKQMLSLGAFVKHYHRTTFNALKLGVDSLRRHSIKVLKKNAKKYAQIQKTK